MTKETWKKAEVSTAIHKIADLIAEHFGVTAPKIENIPGRDWEYRTEKVQVWTIAGPAEIVVDIDKTFAHMYFRFNDPKRALVALGEQDRLNQFSGKWNRLAQSLAWFTFGIESDFEAVADKNPNPQEVQEYKERVARELATWANARDEFARDKT